MSGDGQYRIAAGRAAGLQQQRYLVGRADRLR